MKLLFVFVLSVVGMLTAQSRESGFVKVSDGKLYYQKSGSGPAVILLHAHSVDLRMWDAQVPELEKKFTVIRYDLRGYGRSSLPKEGRDFSHVEDLNRLMEALKIEKAHLVGLSLGSWIVLDFLAAHPEKILSVTVASGGLHDPDNWKTETLAERKLRLEKTRDDKLQSIREVKQAGIAKFKADWLNILLTWCGPRRETIRPELQMMIADWPAWQPLHLEPGEGTSQFAATGNPQTTSQILSERKLQTPVLILIGKNDAAGSQNASENLHRILPSAQVVHLPGAGHFSAMETPAAFNAALLQFLTSTPSK